MSWNHDHLDTFSLMLKLNIQAVVWQLCIWLAINRLTSNQKIKKKRKTEKKMFTFPGKIALILICSSLLHVGVIRAAISRGTGKELI